MVVLLAGIFDHALEVHVLLLGVVGDRLALGAQHECVREVLPVKIVFGDGALGWVGVPPELGAERYFGVELAIAVQVLQLEHVVLAFGRASLLVPSPIHLQISIITFKY